MMSNWFNARGAAEIGVELADQFAPASNAVAEIREKKPGAKGSDDPLKDLFGRADREVRPLRLNFFKKAKLANAFKWRLLENGIDKDAADAVTERLVVHLSSDKLVSADDPEDTRVTRIISKNTKHLLAEGNKHIARAEYAEAIRIYEDLIKIDPRHAAGLNNLGAALSKMGRYDEAQERFHQAIKVEPNFADAHSNIGNALLGRGQYAGAEVFFRRALKLNPRFVNARINLGLTLAYTSRLREARGHFEKVLKFEPRNTEALYGLALVDKTEGNFEGADAMLTRVLKINPKIPRAVASQAGMRKMTSADTAWLENAESVAASGIGPLEESELRFAIGKYSDDLENYKQAFENYKRGNELLKPLAETYSQAAREHFVDDMIKANGPGSFARITVGSTSSKPVFVVGMPRSGTSLVEQIISSHPLAMGAGELEFWSDAARQHEDSLRNGTLAVAIREKLAEAYLRVLDEKSSDALRIVDKAPINSDYLGLIYAALPNARIIYMKRDPIDTCLSCYFQKFVVSLNFTMDLADLTHYYKEHDRLMQHWRTVLPPGAILDVPYEDLVANQEFWTRKILEFIDLEWDERVMDFHKTKRPVVTNSFWQVRQKMYTNSVHRWRHYEKYIGPLLSLKRSHR
jgi:tetratricopeptide (TPR) repeat protein